MEKVEVEETQAVKRVYRVFDGLFANNTSKVLRIQYREITEIDGVEVRNEVKEYGRNYEYWVSHEIGQAVLSLINADLLQEDPSVD